MATITFTEITDVAAVGEGRIAVEDVLATRLGISAVEAAKLIESKMVGPFNSDRNQMFDSIGRQMLADLDKPGSGSKPMLAGLPWIAMLLIVSMFMFKVKKR